MIIRHGIKAYNNRKGRKGCAQLDPPLKEQGKKEAKIFFLKLKNEGITFRKIYSSPLLRARQTAEIAGEIFGLNVFINPILGEIFNSQKINMKEEEFNKDTLIYYGNTKPKHENNQELYDRLEELSELEDDCLHISHGYLIRLLSKKMDYEDEYPKPLCGFEFRKIKKCIMLHDNKFNLF